MVVEHWQQSFSPCITLDSSTQNLVALALAPELRSSPGKVPDEIPKTASRHLPPNHGLWNKVAWFPAYCIQTIGTPVDYRESFFLIGEFQAQTNFSFVAF